MSIHFIHRFFFREEAENGELDKDFEEPVENEREQDEENDDDDNDDDDAEYTEEELRDDEALSVLMSKLDEIRKVTAEARQQQDMTLSASSTLHQVPQPTRIAVSHTKAVCMNDNSSNRSSCSQQAVGTPQMEEKPTNIAEVIVTIIIGPSLHIFMLTWTGCDPWRYLQALRSSKRR